MDSEAKIFPIHKHPVYVRGQGRGAAPGQESSWGVYQLSDAGLQSALAADLVHPAVEHVRGSDFKAASR